MTLNKTYGIYDKGTEEVGVKDPSISKNYVLPLELMQDWQQCGVVSDFVAKDEAQEHRDPKKTMNILSTITNELLENAVKFSFDKNKLVTLTLHSYKCRLSIETVNTTKTENAKALCGLVTDLQTKDIETLYFEQLKKSFESDSDESGLGFLSLIKDFNLNLGIKVKQKVTDESSYDIFVKVEVGNESLES
jgi:hypothetical protein